MLVKRVDNFGVDSRIGFKSFSRNRKYEYLFFSNLLFEKIDKSRLESTNKI